jgi:hypothetical protein
MTMSTGCELSPRGGHIRKTIQGGDEALSTVPMTITTITMTAGWSGDAEMGMPYSLSDKLLLAGKNFP